MSFDLLGARRLHMTSSKHNSFRSTPRPPSHDVDPDLTRKNGCLKRDRQLVSSTSSSRQRSARTPPSTSLFLPMKLSNSLREPKPPGQPSRPALSRSGKTANPISQPAALTLRYTQKTKTAEAPHPPPLREGGKGFVSRSTTNRPANQRRRRR